MQNLNVKNGTPSLMNAGLAPGSAEASIAALAARILLALLRLSWRRAVRVLSIGDCNVH
ncbi:hypothetical protein ACG04R_27350 [Roseateles sp. BYS78W]|uniref:Uncharacterized protein n=1 Tax=Pelomonas candidula TaxID=3299025 RepID=A0ABW7HL65_9BURK